MVFNLFVTAFWVSEIESKRRPFKWDFTFGNKSTQQVLNLANTEGSRAQSLFVGPKTARRLSCCVTGRCRAKGTSHQIHMPGLTCQILFRSLSSKPLYYTALIVSPSGTNSLWITPCQSKQITNMFFTRDFWNSSFFGRGEVSPTRLTLSGRIVGKTPRLIASYNLLKEVRICICIYLHPCCHIL